MNKEQKHAILLCRAIGHSWDIFHGESWTPKVAWLDGIRISIRCTNGCGTVRRDVWNRWSGKLLYREYVYPDGYKDAVPEAPEDFHSRAWARVKLAETLEKPRRNSQRKQVL